MSTAALGAGRISTPASAAVDAAAVGQDAAVQCINREGRCLTGHAQHNHARIVAAGGRRPGGNHAIGVGEEVVVVELASLGLPGPARVPEVAGELAFFAVNADDKVVRSARTRRLRLMTANWLLLWTGCAGDYQRCCAVQATSNCVS